eukprot:TRINITY_DN8645_c1_g1_i1.p1 TRINITY_DN8645_c1_g1~~TRINITY_DN8645_c1_g1_i1.p1  ORF type:complete len:601 (+),score=65.07 TRINITY_DN8645_c1_g1_i1:199-2001(+)
MAAEEMHVVGIGSNYDRLRTSHGGGRASSFSDFRTYLSALAQTPQRMMARMGVTVSADKDLAGVRAGTASMTKHLGWLDMVFFGIGSIVGGGIFASSGEVANQLAGPAAVLSYVIAGFVAFLSAMCFAELAVEMQAAGGAFSYIRATFGEFWAYLVGASLLLYNVVCPAAVARTFTAYLATVFQQTEPNSWRIHISGFEDRISHLDFPALALICVLTAICCYSSKETSTVNIITTIIHLLFIGFIIAAGFAYGSSDNLTTASSPNAPSGFFPFGIRGVFTGASVAYFSYLGFDFLATMAEETRNPAFSIPMGFVGSMLISGIIFCSMILSLTFMQPYDKIDTHASFAVAFSQAGFKYASQIVGVGAVLGTITCTLGPILGMGRLLVALGRAAFVPQWFAEIHPTRGTPVNAQLVAMLFSGTVALFVDADFLVNFTSISALFTYVFVAGSLLIHRFKKVVGTETSHVFTYFNLFTTTSVIFVIVYQRLNSPYWLILVGAILLIETLVFDIHFTQGAMRPQPSTWGVPLMPYFAALSIFVCIFLIGSFNNNANTANPSIEFGSVLVGAAIVYLLYGVHASYDNELGMARREAELEIRPSVRS